MRFNVVKGFMNNIKYNNSGLSLLLTVLILSGVLIIGMSASDLVLRVGRTSRKIGSSEIAYYAAETAAEDALYCIEKQTDCDINTLDGDSGQLEEVSATWLRNVYANTQAANTSPAIDSIWTDSVGDINNSNPLNVRLANGSSFQLELNINGVDYPNNLQIWLPGMNNEVIVYNQTTQEQDIYTFPPPVVNVNIIQNNWYIIRIINRSGSNSDYTLSPGGDDPLPIGIIINTVGTYLDQERRLELESKRWQIY